MSLNPSKKKQADIKVIDCQAVKKWASLTTENVKPILKKSPTNSLKKSYEGSQNSI